ncbi:MAG TPA: multicopper oxidase family protein [Stellaceae bacterium]|nr:multicopper oxidase family protein [Stellaceae bacterium]
MLSRRTVMMGALTAGLVPAARAQTPPTKTTGDPASRTVLRLQNMTLDVNGRAATVFAIRQPNGTAGIVTDVGRPFYVRVENQISEPSLIHWHGLTPPWQQDGVPGLSGPPIPPGGSSDYDFPLRFGGTFWMHSHQGLQEQLLMAAPLIIHDQRDRRDQQEVVLMLADFGFTPPQQIFEDLKKPKKMAAMPAAGAAAAPDLNDVKYDAFLANDRTLADPETVKVEPGAPVLLRIINSSSMSAYHIDLGQLDGELIAVDGFQVKPITGRYFPIAVAQRLDIRLRMPRGPGAYPVLAVLEGERNQTGIVLAARNAPISRIPQLAEKASRALTLELESRLRAIRPLRARNADRVHTIDLTGNMATYSWSLNNVVWNPNVPPLPIAKGERVELVLVNNTPMPHPMHLHGHEFQVVEIDGKRFPGAVRDTVLVTPGRRVVVAFDANNPGWWAFHCHLLYHLDAGMFTTFKYV